MNNKNSSNDEAGADEAAKSTPSGKKIRTDRLP